MPLVGAGWLLDVDVEVEYESAYGYPGANLDEAFRLDRYAEALLE